MLETKERISPSEILQVGERIRGVRLPLFIIQLNTRNEQVSQMWHIPGTSVRVSRDGDIFYPSWVERAQILKPELYAPCSDLPRGWTLERLIASQRRPISEVVFHQVKKDAGSVETAIRITDHVLEKFSNKGKELEQVEAIRAQIEQARQVLSETQGVSREEFEDGFEFLYKQTLELMEISGMRRAKSALKKDVERLLEGASIGKDRLNRRNPMAMLKRLDAAARRVEYRWNEAGFVVEKFSAMKAGLIEQRNNERQRLEQLRHELNVGLAAHQVFKIPEKGTTSIQKAILMGKIGTLIYSLEQVRVKPYKPVARQAVEGLKGTLVMMREGNYQGAKEIFQQVLQRTSEILTRFQNIKS